MMRETRAKVRTTRREEKELEERKRNDGDEKRGKGASSTLVSYPTGPEIRGIKAERDVKISERVPGSGTFDPSG
ncbi:hypothetical protein Pcinc_043528 [Petrolisthes cinctipes]|uniref:Uncharacterized protein n=1 Tax=Petrolisthes cinctipes TaxID=88211 RepID=A0AAE1EF01_PETCI|nr:hypothetical protein Pcinc_043528 [Petrolisthes cinctipes]